MTDRLKRRRRELEARSWSSQCSETLRTGCAEIMPRYITQSASLSKAALILSGDAIFVSNGRIRILVCGESSMRRLSRKSTPPRRISFYRIHRERPGVALHGPTTGLPTPEIAGSNPETETNAHGNRYSAVVSIYKLEIHCEGSQF